MEPDEAVIRALIEVASDETTARAATFGQTERRDWVANSLAGLKPVRAGRFLVHGRHDRSRVKANEVAIEIEAGLAFGTGHHGTTRGCLLHFGRLLKRRRPKRVLDVGCGAGVLPSAPPRSCAVGSGSATSTPCGHRRERQRSPERRGGPLPGDCLAGGRERAPARGRALRPRVRQYPGEALAAARAVARGGHQRGWGGDRLRPTSCRCSGRACVLRAQGFDLAKRIELEGWASLRLRR